MIFAISSDLLYASNKSLFHNEVVNIFISSCVHIFIHQERGDELLIRSTIKERSLAASYRGLFESSLKRCFY